MHKEFEILWPLFLKYYAAVSTATPMAIEEALIFLWAEQADEYILE